MPEKLGPVFPIASLRRTALNALVHLHLMLLFCNHEEDAASRQVLVRSAVGILRNSNLP